MCHSYGSLDQATNVCLMCKVFPHARCPHNRDVCRNRAVHPRLDVLYLKNAEVDWFNGCGYCKWARTNPPPKQAGYHNPGWPGCCRPPQPNEYRMIQAADWRSVSIIHHIPIPMEVKAALDNLSPKPSSPTTPRQGSKASIPTIDRKNSNGSPPSKLIIPGKASAAVTIPGKGQSAGSPKLSTTSLSGGMSRSNSISTSVPTSWTLEQANPRRPGQADASERQSSSAQSSPNRKHLDLDSPPSSRRHSGSRTSLPAVNSPQVSVSKSTQSSQSPERRRAPPSVPVINAAKSSPPSRAADRPSTFLVARSKKDDDGISSASSSSGSGSLTDSTITSDGGFTDYLSDESEEELQRQAEAKAALVAQNQAEEMEFKAARQQLAHVDLRPPKSWNPTNLTNTSSSTSRVATKG